ncbi:MAG: yjeA [Chlamydiales bacterium]|nr:yjeA [Chlamydiales bacterium]
MLAAARSFFAERGVMEVDCPSLSQRACIDAYIDLIEAKMGQTPCYLHSSPEYGMKRLLALGLRDIYQISHVFRSGEVGRKHNPEFTMVEWYRTGLPFQALIEETLSFISLFIEAPLVSYLTYSQAFQKYAGFSYEEASVPFLKGQIEKAQIISHAESYEDLIDVTFSLFVEPHLGRDELTVLLEFPAFQASLAKTRLVRGTRVADRFEVYYQALELCNGYHELTEPLEQEKRLLLANAERQLLGKSTYPIDHLFLEALKQGLPDSVGVAVGFDRLMMLRLQADEIGSVIPFDWHEA